jgi:hypothetical protein
MFMLMQPQKIEKKNIEKNPKLVWDSTNMHNKRKKPFHITSKTSINMLHTPPHNHLPPKRRPPKNSIFHFKTL